MREGGKPRNEDLRRRNMTQNRLKLRLVCVGQYLLLELDALAADG